MKVFSLRDQKYFPAVTRKLNKIFFIFFLQILAPQMSYAVILVAWLAMMPQLMPKQRTDFLDWGHVTLLPAVTLVLEEGKPTNCPTRGLPCPSACPRAWGEWQEAKGRVAQHGATEGLRDAFPRHAMKRHATDHATEEVLGIFIRFLPSLLTSPLSSPLPSS